MKKFLAALLLALSIGSATAQQPAAPSAPPMCGFASLPVTGTSARVALASSNTTSCAVITVYNDSSQEAFFALGDVTVVATVSNTPIPAGKSLSFWANLGTPAPAVGYIAAITSTSTATLRVLQGPGPLPYN